MILVKQSEQNMQSESLVLIRKLWKTFEILNWIYCNVPCFSKINFVTWKYILVGKFFTHSSCKDKRCLPSLVTVFILSQQSESDWQSKSDKYTVSFIRTLYTSKRSICLEQKHLWILRRKGCFLSWEASFILNNLNQTRFLRRLHRQIGCTNSRTYLAIKVN